MNNSSMPDKNSTLELTLLCPSQTSTPVQYSHQRSTDWNLPPRKFTAECSQSDTDSFAASEPLATDPPSRNLLPHQNDATRAMSPRIMCHPISMSYPRSVQMTPSAVRIV